MFNQKEEGYDEFVAKCIRKGLKDIENGRVCSPDEVRAFAMQVIERKVREIEKFEQQETLRYA